MTSILCQINTGDKSYPCVKWIKNPLEINYQWLLNQFPGSLKTIRATWYTGVAEKNELYYEQSI